MIGFVDGRWIDAEEPAIPVLDRSFTYGDGLFETLRVHRGRPLFWRLHWQRLARGCEFLKIRFDWERQPPLPIALQLIERNAIQDGVLRITLSRGSGTRGYSPKSATHPVVAMTMHPPASAPPRWRLITSSYRVFSGDPLLRLKTNNRLLQVLVKSEADEQEADDAVILNERCEVTECSAANLFWIRDKKVLTPPDSAGLLPGITRETVNRLLADLGRPSVQQAATVNELWSAEGVFLTLSTQGIVDVTSIDGHELPRSDLAQRLREQYWALSEQCSG